MIDKALAKPFKVLKIILVAELTFFKTPFFQRRNVLLFDNKCVVLRFH